MGGDHGVVILAVRRANLGQRLTLVQLFDQGANNLSQLPGLPSLSFRSQTGVLCRGIELLQDIR